MMDSSGTSDILYIGDTGDSLTSADGMACDDWKKNSRDRHLAREWLSGL